MKKMLRSELSEAGRTRLNRLVADLFSGVGIKCSSPSSESGEVRFLCYRGRGEELPDLDLAESLFGASQSGIFLSCNVLSGDTVTSQTWVRYCSLDDVLSALNSFEIDTEMLLAQYELQSIFRHAMRRPESQDWIEVITPAGEPQVSAPTRSERFRP